MTLPAFATVDLNTCDNEPIHIPGAIQPHGVLLALTHDQLVVEQLAGDTLGVLGIAPEDLLGQPVEGWLGLAQVARLRDALQVQRQLTRSLPLFELVLPQDGRRLDVLVHDSEGVVILECETPLGAGDADTLATLQMMQLHVAHAPSVAALCQEIANAVHAATGFQRVMVYRFLPDGGGIVDAEARDTAAASFLGLRFPASDIPRQARAMYLTNWLRLIPDAAYTPAPLRPLRNPTTGRMLDLSQSVLRSVSPIHLEYLANMGVAATMTISIVRKGQLWGLIACHHPTPRHVPARLRVACELFAEMASLRIEPEVTAQELQARLAARHVLEDLLLGLAHQPDLASGLTQLRPNLLDLIPAGAVSLWFNGHTTSIGATPTPEQIEGLIAWLGTQPEAVFATDRLAELYPPAQAFASVASGVLALSLTRMPADYVLWFLPETVSTVIWAGDPTKVLVPGPHGDRLSPRGSFAAWRQEMRLRSRPWLPAEIAAATALRTALLEVVLRRVDLVAREQEAARRQQNVLMAELDHRVKNMLATIKALATLSTTEGQTIEGFLATFEGRLQAMSLAHNLLTRSRWEGIDLRALIDEELAPFAGPGTATVLIAPRLPAVLLRSKAALAFSLGLHELATNAAKYGALSVPGGQVHLAWHEETLDGRRLVLRWVESGGPPVRAPQQRGFGLTLIESCLSYELGGTVAFSYPVEGVSCTVTVPWDQIASITPPPAAVAAPERAGLAGAHILLVEDNALVAQSVVMCLQRAGAAVVGPAPRLPAAIALAETMDIDGAVLDVDLDGTMVWPAADVLARRGIPFFFATGYQASLVMPPRFRDRFVLNKPFSLNDLKDALQRMLSAEQ